MLIKLKLHNFKMFLDSEFDFQKINLISGENGVGKSSVGLEALLFLLYGYIKGRKLTDLLSRANKATNCYVEGLFCINNIYYIIRRDIPTKVTMKINGVYTENASYKIEQLFGTREQFMKFHLIDSYQKDINFLEDGQTSLKKILLSVFEDYFNNIRGKLVSIKQERESYNRDNLNIFKHYYSTKRINLLQSCISNIDNEKTELNSLLRKREQEILSDSKEIATKKYNSNQLKVNIMSLETGICKECKQIVKVPFDLIAKNKSQIDYLEYEIDGLNAYLETVKIDKEQIHKKIQSLQQKRDKLLLLKSKIESSIVPEKYKYSTRDVINCKCAIEELDNITSYCLSDKLCQYIPIINNILSKLNIKIDFEYSNKELLLSFYKDNIKWKYNDLSQGQKLIVQIALKLALLLENNTSIPILIADEGLECLTQENLQYIIQLFQDYPVQLIFVVHRLETIPEKINVINLLFC